MIRMSNPPRHMIEKKVRRRQEAVHMLQGVNIIIGCKSSKASNKFRCMLKIRIRLKVCWRSGSDYGWCTDPNVHGFHPEYAYYQRQQPWHLAYGTCLTVCLFEFLSCALNFHIFNSAVVLLFNLLL
jgi:hypothetical protein